uniref:Uncharacterized protein n=1 Tax=Cacopsylla melanoneura TaxID=428564 RepID=A0A8D8X8U7_9HEMI
MFIYSICFSSICFPYVQSLDSSDTTKRALTLLSDRFPISSSILILTNRTLEFISFCRHFFVDKTFSFEIFMQHSTFSYQIFVQHFSFSYEFSMQHFLTFSYEVFTFRAKFDM